MFRRRRFEQDMSDELAFHLEARAQDLIRSGVPEHQARRRARIEFGGMEGWKESCREARSFRPVLELRADLWYGLRAIARSPAFALAAILSLGIGIGVNTAIFSLIDATWFRPMAVPHENRIARVFTTSPDQNEGWFSWPEYEEFAKQSRSFSGVVAVGGRGARIPRPDGTMELVLINAVSENFFSTLGVNAAAGRLFAPEDGHALTEHPVVVLGHAFWRRRYNGDPSIVGRQIELEGGSGGRMLVTVCGVLPESFRGTGGSAERDIWMPPQTFTALRGSGDFSQRGFRWFEVLGRIRPGTSVRTASAEAAVIASRLAANWPDTNRGRSARVISDFAYRLQGTRGPGVVFGGVVLLVLLMSSVNVANLLIARAAARGREMSIRAAMGAGRARIVRQVFTESCLLGAGGLLAGVLLGWAFIRILPAIIGEVPGYHAAMVHADLDQRVLIFSALLSLATTVLFGLAPAVDASRVELGPLMRSTSGLGLARGLRTRQVLVAPQVALSFVLLALAALLISSYARTRTADLGIARREQLVLFCALADNMNPREAVAHLRALPGVQDVAMAIRTPLSVDEGGRGAPVTFPDRPEIGRATPLEIKYNAIDSRFLRVMGTPVVRGRDFDETDQNSGPPVVLISQTMAARFWAGRDPLGATIRVGPPPGVERRIVGIVRDVRFNSIDQPPEPYMYLPWYRGQYGEATFIVNTRQPAELLKDTGRRALIAMDRRLDPMTVSTEGELIRFSGLQYQLLAELLSVFGLIGLVLSAIGLYGVVAWSVTHRTQEIGIRLALGASRGATLGLVLRQTALVEGAGMVVGLALAMTVTKLGSAMLYETSPWDPGMLAAAAAMLGTVLLVASFIPANRATRIEPMPALRVE
jgi:predicted permease